MTALLHKTMRRRLRPPKTEGPTPRPYECASGLLSTLKPSEDCTGWTETSLAVFCSQG